MHQNTIFIAISAVHVSGFSSPSSGAQETYIRFVRAVVVTDERGLWGVSVGYLYVLNGSRDLVPRFGSICFDWYPGIMGCVGLYITYI
jgi:hypothetical protein